MEASPLQLSRTGARAEIRICRPQRANALNAAFWAQLPQLLEEVERDPQVRSLLIHSEGEHFSAGMDLDFFADIRAMEASEPGRYREWLRRQVLALQAPINQLEHLRVPVVAVIQGGCIGGALDIVCATNLRFVTAEAYFRIHEINIGMMADLGVLQRLPKMMSPAVVQDLALTGRRMSAEEARHHGFVNAVLPDPEAAMAAAREACDRIEALSPLAVAGTKAALLHARDHRVADGLAFASLWNAGMFITEDVPLAIEAQQARRTAAFQDVLP